MSARLPLLLLTLLAAVAIAGCGGSPSTGALEPAQPGGVTVPRHQPVPILPAKKLLKRARAFCRKVNAQTRGWQAPVTGRIQTYAQLHADDAFLRRVVVRLHQVYRRFHALGIPEGGRVRRRWIGFLSQFKATIDHLDELQAGAESLDGYYALQSFRQFRKAAAATTRRGNRLGLHVCVS